VIARVPSKGIRRRRRTVIVQGVEGFALSRDQAGVGVSAIAAPIWTAGSVQSTVEVGVPNQRAARSDVSGSDIANLESEAPPREIGVTSGPTQNRSKAKLRGPLPMRAWIRPAPTSCLWRSFAPHPVMTRPRGLAPAVLLAYDLMTLEYFSEMAAARTSPCPKWRMGL
jgi:hypothetical protein